MRTLLGYIYRLFIVRRFKLSVIVLVSLYCIYYYIQTHGLNRLSKQARGDCLEGPNSVCFASSDQGCYFLDLGGSDWTVKNENGSIFSKAKVPGGVYTDLINGGVLNKGDVYYR